MAEIVARVTRQNELMARLCALLLSPRREWRAIAAEPSDPLTLFVRVILPLSAIPPAVKLFAWSLVFGFLSFGTALLAALLAYVLSLASLWLLAVIASRLAPYFDGSEDFDEALKLVAYAATASWLGGIFRLVPALGVLSLLATLYSLFLLARGAPALLGVPTERAPAYAAAIGFAALCLFILVAATVASLLGVAALGMA